MIDGACLAVSGAGMLLSRDAIEWGLRILTMLAMLTLLVARICIVLKKGKDPEGD